MYAYKPQRQPQVTPLPRKKRRRRSSQRIQQQSRRQKANLIELSLQTSVNCICAGVAIAAIANLLPTHLSQQEQLAEIRVEVAEAEYRVNQLRQDFNENFDAYESEDLMQKRSSKVNPQQKRIIWVDPE